MMSALASEATFASNLGSSALGQKATSSNSHRLLRNDEAANKGGLIIFALRRRYEGAD